MTLPLQLPGLDFQLGEEIDALRDTVRAFAQAEIAPQAGEIDRSDRFPMELWRKLGALGVLGITVGEEYGGANMGYLAHMVAMEEISRALLRSVENEQPDFDLIGLAHAADLPGVRRKLHNLAQRTSAKRSQDRKQLEAMLERLI